MARYFFRSRKKPHVAEVKAITEVDWINGAFIMTKKAVLATAGLLDEDFFLYARKQNGVAGLSEQDHYVFMETSM